MQMWFYRAGQEPDTSPNGSASIAGPVLLNSSTPGTIGFAGNVGDANDWWKVTVGEPGLLSAMMWIDTNQPGNQSIHIRLFDSDGTAGWGEAETASVEQPVSVGNAVQTGTYYLRISPDGSWGGSSGYRINCRFDAVDSPYDSWPNGSPSEAAAIRPQRSRTGAVEFYGGGDDAVDWWAVTITESGWLDTTMWIDTNQPGNQSIHIKLYDTDSTSALGELDATSMEQPVTVGHAVQAGTYYLRIGPDGSWGGSSGYILTPDFTPAS
jgi:hypothetical protein